MKTAEGRVIFLLFPKNRFVYPFLKFLMHLNSLSLIDARLKRTCLNCDHAFLFIHKL